MVVWAEATRLTKSACEVLVDVVVDVAGEVSQYDTSVTDVLSTSWLLLLLLLLLSMMLLIVIHCAHLFNILDTSS